MYPLHESVVAQASSGLVAGKSFMTSMRHFLVAGAVVACAAGYSTTASAIAPMLNGFGGTVDYGAQCLSPNDDGSSAIIDLTPAFPNGLHFFTSTHTSAYVNTNGNITFNSPVSTFTPNPFPVAAQPMIAPYWADVDIRGASCSGSTGSGPCQNPAENGVWWHLEPGRMVVTWDRVGYYSCNTDLRMTFQLVITEAVGCAGSGDFDVEFRYNLCNWETGDVSGGTNGFGGTEAQAGFDAGNQVDFLAIPGSMAAGIANNLCTNSNVGQSGIWQFQIRSGAVLCPEAGTPCDTGLLGVCANGRNNCVGSTTECVPEVPQSVEQCDGLDNDCDGGVDEETEGPICSGGWVCSSGTCVPQCSELGCGDGEVCDPSGLCVDEECLDVTCDPGLVCRDGNCVGACDGVICPWSLSCRAGQCVDLCASLTCDDCTVCEEGLCVPKCEHVACDPGATCLPDGYCIEDACVGVTCNPGFHCEGGNCVDNCMGAVCPSYQVCQDGLCVAEPPPPDGGGTEFGDSTGAGGSGGAGGDPGSEFNINSGTRHDCGCEVVGATPRDRGSLAWLFAAALVVAGRRRTKRLTGAESPLNGG